MRGMIRAGRLCAAAALALWVGCGTEDTATQRDDARAAVEAALKRADRDGALQALEPLRARANTADELIELSALMARAGEAAQAVWMLEDALATHPDRDDLRVQLAKLALLVQDPSRTRQLVEPITPQSPQHPEALMLRGRAELELGDSAAALETFAQAIALYPERPESVLARVQALAQEGRAEEARAGVEAALANPRLDADSQRAFEIIAAEFDARAGKIDDAVARLSELVEADPDDRVSWQALATLLMRTGRHEQAANTLSAAIHRDPSATALYGLLAEVHESQGHPDDAEEVLERLVEVSDTPSHWMALARLRHDHGDRAGAAAALSDATRAHPGEPMLQMHLAEKQIDAGNFDAARRSADAFRAQRSGDPHVEYLQARIALADGRFDLAGDRLRALVSRLDTAYTQFWLGRALEEGGDLAGAERRFGLAVQRDPHDPALPAALLRVAQRRGDWRAVAAAARTLVARAPRESHGYRMLAIALLRLDEGKAAEVAARGLQELEPDTSEPVLLIARALRVQGRAADAQTELSAALKVFPHPELQAEQAFGKALAGNVEQAHAEAKALAAKYPASVEVQRTLAALAFARGATEEGSAATDRALLLTPKDPEPLGTRARYAASRGLWDVARGDLLRAQEMRPHDAEFAFLLGAVESGAGDPAAAERAYRRAAEIDERHFPARNNLAWLLAERGELEEALAFAQQAHALDAENVDGLDTLGWLYLQSGLVDRAIAFLERASAAAPNQDDVRNHLILAYQKAGRSAEAEALSRAETPGAAVQ
jgi:tetratricopeptide (TPR) repeat protein